MGELYYTCMEYGMYMILDTRRVGGHWREDSLVSLQIASLSCGSGRIVLEWKYPATCWRRLSSALPITANQQQRNAFS